MEQYGELMQTLLKRRGIATSEQAENFLTLDYEKGVYNPFLLKDMSRAVERIIKAIKKKEKIVIYSDYDADGIPGGVVLHDFFKKIGYGNFSNYIPHRHDEGFGLNIEAIEEFAKNKTKLLITIDCGIADVDKVTRANELGIDVIITDHHEPGAVIPKAYAIINPKQADCTYPEKILCGSGVIFKLVQALLTKKDELGLEASSIKEGWEKWLLDMVGIATLSDMVPLIGENRIFAHYGLKVLRKSPRLGLVKLLAKLKINQSYVTEDDIGFMISPRINAASRMGIPMDAWKLLATTDETEADFLSDHLNKINDERKGVVASMVKEIRKTILTREHNGGDIMKEVLVLGNPEWKPSLLGLVANSLKDDHNRPVFLWGRETGTVIKGSCRSDGSVSVVEVMELARDSFIEFGGHSMSGGFSVEHEKIHDLEARIVDAYKRAKQKEKVELDSLYDKKLSLNDVNWDTYRVIEQLSPYGVGNPKPTFLFESAEIVEMKKFGKESNHLELLFLNDRQKKIPAIGFFAKEESFTKRPIKGEKIDLLATIEKSTFRNFPELRLRIVDVL